ncbi:glycosyltransferase family 4 protein [Mycolicibacterium sp. Y3]
MKVLQVTDGFAPAVGGTERVVEALAKGLTARGHSSTVVTLGRPDAPAHEVDGGVDVYRIDGFTRYLRRYASDPGHYFHPTFPDPLLVNRLQQLVDDIRPDVVHAHGWILNSCLSLRLSAAPLVATLHDYGLSCAKKTLIQGSALDTACEGRRPARCTKCSVEAYGLLKGLPTAMGLWESRRRFGRVTRFLPISAAVEAASLHDVPTERIERIPSFVADSIFDEAHSDPPKMLPSGPFVIFVGALGEHKGVGLAVAAHEMMRTAVPLVMIGTERSDTIRYPGTPSRPVLTLTDISHPQIMASLAAAAVAVVPSRWQEPLGLVAIEAMAAGTAVVATDVGALPEVVRHGSTGLVVAANDPAALAVALDSLVSDRKLAETFGAAGMTRAHDYTASRVIPRVIDAYDKARRVHRAA